MNAVAGIAVAVAAIAAVADWWSRVVDDRRVELVAKPATLVALIVVAVAIEPTDDVVRWWFVTALVASLAGDVFLLADRFFVHGLAAFLIAHLLYVVGFVAADEWRWERVAVAAVPVAVLVATAGWRIVGAAATSAPSLRMPVVAYLAAISAMMLAAAAAGNGWAIAGAALFVASDTILGWNRFVRSASWMSPAIMVTYHLAQAALVTSLL